MKILLLTIVASIGLYAFIRGLIKSKNNGFYTNTLGLNLFGIYVWGDALILGPFWLISAIIFYFLSAEWILRYTLLFYILRSLIEIIYWINHQVAQRDYIPPLFSNITWLGANESAILYQVMHTCIVLWLIFILIYSFFM